MRHHDANRKFGREKNVREAFVRSLVRALVEQESIETTEARAKEIRPVVEKLVTRGKRDTVANRRLVSSEFNNSRSITKKIFEELGPRYKERAGGYVRIVKSRLRKGDGATMAYISFV